MPSFDTYHIDRYTFGIILDMFTDVSIQIAPDSPVDDPGWRKAFHKLIDDLPYHTFIQSLQYDMGYNLDKVNDAGAVCAYHLDHSLPQARTLSEKYTIPNKVWAFFDECADVLTNHSQNKSSDKRKPKPGYVYLFQTSTGIYKIGQSIDPGKRLTSIQSSLPYKLSSIVRIPTNDMSKLENELHNRFRDKRIRREWFDLSPEDVEYIKGLQS